MQKIFLDWTLNRKMGEKTFDFEGLFVFLKNEFCSNISLL
jgi:hypothetical protein